MGFVVLMAIGLYLLVSVVVVGLATGHAQKSGKSALRWGGGAALVMFLIPFWDWLPTVAVHQYYCAKDSGFWVYKTLDQWKVENPGVIETLSRMPSEEYFIGTSGLYGKQYLLPNGTNLAARFDVKKNFLYVEFKAKDGSGGYWLNQRFNWVIKQERYFPMNYMMRDEQQVVDSKTGEVLARYVDYSASHRRLQAGWSGWKMWLYSPHCIDGEMNSGKFSTFMETATYLGGKGK